MRNKAIIACIAFGAVTSFSYGQSASIKEKSEADLRISDATVHGSANSAADLSAKPTTDDPNYVIGPEDELIVNVWKEADISRTVPVRPDGKISLALVNDVQATGRTPMQLG